LILSQNNIDNKRKFGGLGLGFCCKDISGYARRNNKNGKCGGWVQAV
jgi:hypothetical protein